MKLISAPRAWPVAVAFLLTFLSLGRNTEAALQVAIASDEVRFSWPPGGPPTIAIRELPMHTRADLAAERRTLWTGAARAGAAAVPRREAGRDRLYARFELFDPATGEALGDPQYVTDFSALAVREHALKRPTGKKGLACIVDLDDVRALGVQHANENIDIAGLLDWSNPTPALSFEFEGRKVGLHAGGVRTLDTLIKGKSDLGISVIGILLNYVKRAPGEAVPGVPYGAVGSPLVHPLTNPALVPSGPAAFNTATAEGLFFYRAITQWLIERYTQPEEKFGRLTGLVVGNEIQSHWGWYHLGEATDDEVLREYLVALRVADLAARSTHRDFRIYLSMEHHWAMRGEKGNPRRAMRGVDMLANVAERARREGDFPWQVAFHPYPEDLFKPRFWQDQTAPLSFDAPRITFNNLEVLVQFLHQPQYLYRGQARHIALTEQGFNCPQEPDGEQAQAAAFAFALKRVEAMPEIESFIYHRHVDHPNEGGLRLGLREHDDTSKNLEAMGRKRLLYEVFQKAGTPEEAAAFAFALPIIGRENWEHLVADPSAVKPAAAAK